MDCQEVPEGYKVLYTPMAPGTYLIGIKYGGPNHISGSPFKAKVTGKVVNGGHLLCVKFTPLFLTIALCGHFTTIHDLESWLL